MVLRDRKLGPPPYPALAEEQAHGWRDERPRRAGERRGSANLRIGATRQEIAVEASKMRRAVAPADNHQSLGAGLLVVTRFDGELGIGDHASKGARGLCRGLRRRQIDLHAV